MSVWTAILTQAQGAFDPGRDAVQPDAADGCALHPGDVGFTTAVIGLAAKMARADGAVTDAELAAAAQVFRPPPGEEANFRRVFALAKQSVHGFEGYAKQIGRKYRAQPCLLEDVLDGLFHIAAADGAIAGPEVRYLKTVSEHFGFSDIEFRRIKATNLGPDPGDPYAILGLLPGATLEECRAAWRRMAAENHPDRALQRGAPEAFAAIAQDKMAAINAAWAQIRSELQPATVESAGAA